jgi:uncharacterized protein
MSTFGPTTNMLSGRTLGQLRSMGLLGKTSLALTVTITSLLLWLMFASNPLGGEPHVSLTIERPEMAGEMTGRLANVGIRESLHPEDKTHLNIKIDHQGVPGGVRKEEPIAANYVIDTSSPKTSRALRPKHTVKSLIERSPVGPLPKIGSGGQRPSNAYIRKISPTVARSRKARIAILISGMGLSHTGTRQAISQLPSEITLAFAPYAKDLSNWGTKAKQDGHEVMLQIPMEPFDYPDNDPGPYTLLNRLSVHKNIRRLKWLMSRFSGYFGVTNYMGAKFTASSDTLRPILDELNNRGLVYVDDGSSARSRSSAVAQQIGIGYARANIVIDAEQSDTEILANLKQLEKIAIERGVAIGIGSGLPITIKHIAQWVKTLNKKGIILVPVSATISRSTTQALK